MPAFGRHDDLLQQIPEDVKARAAKAGVTEVDWYAGRLTSSGKKGFSDVPPTRYKHLRKEAQARRDEVRKQQKARVSAPMVSAIAWLRARPRWVRTHLAP